MDDGVSDVAALVILMLVGVAFPLKFVFVCLSLLMLVMYC